MNWIPCTERLPEYGHKVMILVPQDDGETYMAWLAERKHSALGVDFYHGKECGLLETYEVTHWRPRPLDPEGNPVWA